METKCEMRKMERVCRRLKYPNYFIVEARGTVGGMAIMWKDEVNIECIWHSDKILNCSVKDVTEKHSWNLVACHGYPL